MTRQKKTSLGQGNGTSAAPKEDQRADSGLVCNSFMINNHAVGHHVDPMERRKQMEVFYAVQGVVHELRDIRAQNGGTLNGLPKDVLEELATMGIVLTQFQTSGEPAIHIAHTGFQGTVNIADPLWNRH